MAAAPNCWFLTGSQGLYGPETLQQVERQSQEIVNQLNGSGQLPLHVQWQPVLTDAEAIHRVMLEANADLDCLGVIAWMHTFSPAKMWIAGLNALQTPLLHLHTQANVTLPWAEIDMDFMNLNQAAHGDREFGYIQTRLGVPRKTVAGHASDRVAVARVAAWQRAATGAAAVRRLKLARFGDNMRDVAVTEGDKVEAQLRFGVSVNTYGVNDLVAVVDEVNDAEVDKLIEQYADSYEIVPELAVGGARHESLRYGARIEAGLRAFLTDGGFGAFTTNFQDLGGLRQLPGPSGAAVDGRRLRLRRRRRLEDLGDAAHHQGHGPQRLPRHVVHGGLHVPLGAGDTEDSGRPHARGLPQHRHRQTTRRDPSAEHWRPGGSGTAGVRRRARSSHSGWYL